MPSFFHGSYRRYIVDVSKRLMKDARNGWKKLTRPDTRKQNPKRVVEQTIGAAIARDGEAAGMARLNDAIDSALNTKAPDPQTLHYLATALERFADFERAYPLRSQGHALLGQTTKPQWDGRPLPDGNLVITPMQYDHQSLQYAIQYASMIGLAAVRAPGCRIFVHPRLIPIFARSFPSAAFLNEEDMPDVICGPNDCHATLDRLPALFATSAAAIAEAHAPLLADSETTAKLRAKYSPNGEPVIGIAWGSLNSRKDAPSFDAWAALLSGLEATFVSLQYGPVDSAIGRMERSSGKTILNDPTVDQLQDMDRFAAQLGAMDAIVTISNTGAHLAGVMGRPMVVLLDDKFHLTWPYFQDHTPWYPNATLVRRGKRKWAEVMTEAQSIARGLLASGA